MALKAAEWPEVIGDMQSAATTEVISDAPPAHAPWGPDVWPQEVRDNLDEWPPKFRDRELIGQIRTPFVAPRRIVVLARKRGAGKTTIARALNYIYRTYRREGCALLDANGGENNTLRGAIERVASNKQKLVAPKVYSAGYAEQIDKLTKGFPLVVIDLGETLDKRARRAILESADQVIVVATPIIDGVFAASGLLDDLREDGFGELADNATVVINRIRRMPFSDLLNIDRHFAKHCMQVVRVPFDARVGEDIDTHLDGVRPSTRTGLFELAAAVARRAGNTNQVMPREKEKVRT